MKFNDIEDRIAQVNNKLWDYSFPSGSTHLWREDFTEKERNVFDLFEEIMEKYAPYPPPSDVLKHMNPVFDAMQRIWIHRAVDVFVHIVGPIVYMGEDEKTEEFDIKLLEIQLYNFIFARARDRNEERAWTNAVIEVFGHNNYDVLPDTEADPPDPGWLNVDAIMDEYRVNRANKEQENAKPFIKKTRGG